MPGDVLADRVRVLAGKRVTEQRMFGGTFVMLNGNMTLGALPRLG